MLIFPDPNVETEYTDPNGSVWEFNGTGWVRQCDCDGSGGGGGGGAPDDEYWDETYLLINADGKQDGQRNIVDATGRNRVQVWGANTKVDHSNAKYGDGAVRFVRTENGKLEVPTPSFNSPWTAEVWVNQISTRSAGLMGKWVTGDLCFSVQLSSDYVQFDFSFDGVFSERIVTRNAVISSGVYHHIAVTWDGSEYKLWVDGVMAGSHRSTQALHNSDRKLAFASIDGKGSLDGHLDDIRFTEACRYTEDFTPSKHPAPEPEDDTGDPLWGYVTLLVNGEEEYDGSQNIVDFSGISETSAVNNAYITSNFNYIKHGTGSIEVRKAGQDMVLASKTRAIRTDPFCIEGWFRTVSGNNALFCFSKDPNSPQSGGNIDSPGVHISSGTLRVYASNSNNLTGVSWTHGQYNHVALTRDASNQMRLFLNGAKVWERSDTKDYDCTNVTIGRLATVYQDGYFDDFRVTIGDARYVSDFTPPEELPASYAVLNVPKVIQLNVEPMSADNDSEPLGDNE
jgi:hypothetical protein